MYSSSILYFPFLAAYILPIISSSRHIPTVSQYISIPETKM